MGYCIANIECCEPTMLRVDPDVEVVLGAQRGMCAPVLLFADDRDRLVAYFKDQWGGDEEWTAEVRQDAAAMTDADLEVYMSEWAKRRKLVPVVEGDGLRLVRRSA